ncbi:hypothetical protein DT385_01320 [Pseudomonas syringae]|nr:hypothetical protein DT385_01320 [Pseudomonas syringae]
MDLAPDKAEPPLGARLASSKPLKRILSDISAVPLTRLMPHSTNGKGTVIDKYNNEQPSLKGYSYVDSVINIAGRSHAADEIRRLNTELIGLRL